MLRQCKAHDSEESIEFGPEQLAKVVQPRLQCRWRDPYISNDFDKNTHVSPKRGIRDATVGEFDQINKLWFQCRSLNS